MREGKACFFVLRFDKVVFAWLWYRAGCSPRGAGLVLVVRACKILSVWIPGSLELGMAGTTGTGIDSLQRANHAFLFELPFVEAEGQRAAGRIHGAGQQLPCHGTTLWAADSEAETLIKKRHERRMRRGRPRPGGRGRELGVSTVVDNVLCFVVGYFLPPPEYRIRACSLS